MSTTRVKRTTAAKARPTKGSGGMKRRAAAHVATAAAQARAAELAAKMPLVHFPANVRFDSWISWDGLKSLAARGFALEPGPFGALRGTHVFVYGGPSCYYRDDCVGDAAIYFSPGVEAGRTGGATPFDSGSLEDSPARLQPFRSRRAGENERWAFFIKHQVDLAGWRPRFEGWLAHAYDDPDRYLETLPDHYAAGEPDRLKPASLLQHNGTRGRARYGKGECGDRRTWTWEIRIEAELPFDQVALLHVPYDTLQEAQRAADRLRFQGGVRPTVIPLPPEVPASFRLVYEHSGEVVRKLVNP